MGNAAIHLKATLYMVWSQAQGPSHRFRTFRIESFGTSLFYVKKKISLGHKLFHFKCLVNNFLAELFNPFGIQAHAIDSSFNWRRPLLFADFLSANLLIHISKLVQNDNYLVKKWTFYLRIQDSWSKMTKRIYRE